MKLEWTLCYSTVDGIFFFFLRNYLASLAEETNTLRNNEQSTYLQPNKV